MYLKIFPVFDKPEPLFQYQPYDVLSQSVESFKGLKSFTCGMHYIVTPQDTETLTRLEIEYQQFKQYWLDNKIDKTTFNIASTKFYCFLCLMNKTKSNKIEFLPNVEYVEVRGNTYASTWVYYKMADGTEIPVSPRQCLIYSFDTEALAFKLKINN